MRDGRRQRVEGDLTRVLPQRSAAGLACTSVGTAVAAVGVGLAGGSLRALGWLALFTILAAVVTATSELIPMQDGAHDATPAPRRPAVPHGRRHHLAAGARSVVVVVLMGGVASSAGWGPSGLARLGGVLLGVGLCSVAGAVWLARWERRTGMILVQGIAPEPPRSARGQLAKEDTGHRVLAAPIDVGAVQRRLMCGQPLSAREARALERSAGRARRRHVPQTRYFVVSANRAQWPQDRPEPAPPATPAPTDPHDRRQARRRGLAAGALLLLGIGLIAGLATTPAEEPAAPEPSMHPLALAGPCPGVAPLPPPRVGASFEVDDHLAGFVMLDGLVWAATAADSPWLRSASGNELVAFDPRTGLVRRRFRLDLAPSELVAAGGWLWAMTGVDRSVVRLDPRTGRRAGDAIDVGGIPIEMAAGDGAVWVLLAGGGTLTRIVPASGEIDATFDTGTTAWRLAAGAGAVWLPEGRGVRRIDARSGASRTIALAGEPYVMAVGSGSLWALGYDILSRIDLRTLRETARIPVGAESSDAVPAGAAVWLALGDGRIARVDPRCDRVVAPLVRIPGATSLVATGDAVWAFRDDARAVRISAGS